MKPEVLAPGEQENVVLVPAGHVRLLADLRIPDRTRGIVVFAHGSGSSRHSPRNQHVANVMRGAALGTLLVDLLMPDEEHIDDSTGGESRFDIDLLATRLVDVVDWLHGRGELRTLPIGIFGAGTGAGAALVVAALRPQLIQAVVSRGGRPDLAGRALGHVQCPTLLIVGGDDQAVLSFNRAALVQLQCARTLEIIPGASHLFEEPGALDEVAVLARDWFKRYLTGSRAAAA